MDSYKLRFGRFSLKIYVDEFRDDQLAVCVWQAEEIHVRGDKY
jgi:hypothetical protein